MLTRRLTNLAVLLAAVLVMGVGVAKAQESRVRLAVLVPPGADPIYPLLYPVRVIVTGDTAPDRTFETKQMENLGFSGIHEGSTIVAVGSVGNEIVELWTAYYSEPPPPGTQFHDIFNWIGIQFNPDGSAWFVYEGTIVPPQNYHAALVTTPAGVTLTEDHEGVVGGGTDEFGISDAVCVKKGSQAINTPIICDIDLEAGDRLTDFFEIDYDPETGETTYVCWLEY
jgi:hypothetical protein